MITKFLQLRFQQTIRIISTVGWLYKVGLLIMLIWAVAGIAVKSSQSQGSLVLTVVFILIIGSLHWLRPDIKFLKAYFDHYRFICISEYLVLSVPLLIGTLFSPYPFLPISYIGLLFALVYLLDPLKTTPKKAIPMIVIPNQYFEWKSGLRKNFYSLSILLILGGIFSYHIGIAITSIFLIGLITIGIYDFCEPISILTASRQNPKSFLLTRVKGLLLISNMLYLPLFLLHCIFHPNYWYVPFIIILVLLSYQFYALTIKYAFYEPNARSGKKTVLLSLGALVFVLPFILPAIWVLSIKLYFQSIKKLSIYLHDYH